MSPDIPPPSFPSLDTDAASHAAAIQRLTPHKRILPWGRSHKHSDVSSTSPAQGNLSSPSFLSRPPKPTREASAFSAAPQIRLTNNGGLNNVPVVEDGENFRWAVVYENQRGCAISSVLK